MCTAHSIYIYRHNEGECPIDNWSVKTRKWRNKREKIGHFLDFFLPLLFFIRIYVYTNPVYRYFILYTVYIHYRIEAVYYGIYVCVHTIFSLIPIPLKITFWLVRYRWCVVVIPIMYCFSIFRIVKITVLYRVWY